MFIIYADHPSGRVLFGTAISDDDDDTILLHNMLFLRQVQMVVPQEPRIIKK